jgi:hypothetical protein
MERVAVRVTKEKAGRLEIASEDISATRQCQWITSEMV